MNKNIKELDNAMKQKKSNEVRPDQRSGIHRRNAVAVDPWDSVDIKDYKTAFKNFGVKEFSADYKKKFDHFLFERDMVIAHRDFEKVMRQIEQKKKFINITGIAASGKLHLGHKVDLDMFNIFKESFLILVCEFCQ